MQPFPLYRAQISRTIIPRQPKTSTGYFGLARSVHFCSTVPITVPGGDDTSSFCRQHGKQHDWQRRSRRKWSTSFWKLSSTFMSNARAVPQHIRLQQPVSSTAQSLRNVSVIAVTAYLEAPYTLRFGKAKYLWPAMLFTFTMWPATARARIEWYASRVHRTSPSTFVSSTVRRSCVLPGDSRATCGLATPALLIRTSTPPNRRFTNSNAARIDASSVTSHACAWIRWPASTGRSSRKASIRSTRLASPTVIMPARASLCTTAAPMPELAPVTIATFPTQRSIGNGRQKNYLAIRSKRRVFIRTASENVRRISR
uniref:Uncharacterized protein n=1 Tax=Anopheles atroparvus TaxID=41427 RepID=A0A182ILB9_ANOAO